MRHYGIVFSLCIAGWLSSVFLQDIPNLPTLIFPPFVSHTWPLYNPNDWKLTDMMENLGPQIFSSFRLRPLCNVSFEYLPSHTKLLLCGFYFFHDLLKLHEAIDAFLTLLIALPLTSTLRELCQYQWGGGVCEFNVMINGVLKGVFSLSYLSSS